MKQLFFLLMAAASFCQVSAQKTQFGIMSGTVYQSQVDSKAMGNDLLIRNHVAMQNGTGVRQMTPGYSYITNFVWDGGAFTTDMVAYEKQLRWVLSLMPVKPRYAVIENEENMNPDLAAYCLMYETAKKVFAEYGIRVLNGGITNGAAVALAYDYFMSKGRKADAQYLALNNKKGNRNTLAQAKLEAAFLVASGDTTITFHYLCKNAKSVKDLQLIIEGLKGATKLQPINNELGQMDESPATTTAVVNTSKLMPLVVFYITTGKAGNATTFTQPMKLAAAAAMK